MGLQDWPQDPFEDSVDRFARDLKALRMTTGLSLRDVAGKGNASHDSIHQAERGFRVPTVAITAAYVKGVGGNSEEVSRWKERCQRLRHQLMQTGSAAPAAVHNDKQDLPSGSPEEAPNTPLTSRKSTDEPAQDADLISVTRIDDATESDYEDQRSDGSSTATPSTGRSRHADKRMITLVVLVAALAVPASVVGAYDRFRGDDLSGPARTALTPTPLPTPTSVSDSARTECPGEGCEGQSPYAPSQCHQGHENLIGPVEIQASNGDLIGTLQLVGSSRCNTYWAKIATADQADRRMTITLTSSDGRTLTNEEIDNFLYTSMTLARPEVCYSVQGSITTRDGSHTWRTETYSTC